MCPFLVSLEILTQELVSPDIDLAGVGTLRLIFQAEVSNLDGHHVPKVEHEFAFELGSRYMLLFWGSYVSGTDVEAHHADDVDRVHRNRKHIAEALPLHCERIAV